MGHTRRFALFAFTSGALLCAQLEDPREQIPRPDQRMPRAPNPDEDIRLPNGKSQKDAIAKQQHEQAVKDANDLVTLANQLKTELEKAGSYVVPVGSVKKTEEIEKLARRIRSRLKE